MLTPEQNLEVPMWKELAMAVINRGAQDYILAMMEINGEGVPKTAMNVEVRSKPERVRDDCETFFFSGWFRILSADTGLDGMVLATTIESEWREMYDRMQKAKSGRPASGDRIISDSQREHERRKARERYYRKKAEMAERAARAK